MRVTETQRRRHRAEGRVSLREAALALGRDYSWLWRQYHGSPLAVRDGGTLWIPVADLAAAEDDPERAAALRALLPGPADDGHQG